MTHPIRREVIVKTPPARAFATFTDAIGDWWPVREHGVLDGTVAFEDHLLVERTVDAESIWAEVTEWNPPHSIALDWHPGSTPELATRLRVEFTEHDDGTLVVLTHAGWERRPDGDSAAQEYDDGWIVVLGSFAASAENTDPADE